MAAQVTVESTDLSKRHQEQFQELKRRMTSTHHLCMRDFLKMSQETSQQFNDKLSMNPVDLSSVLLSAFSLSCITRFLSSSLFVQRSVDRVITVSKSYCDNDICREFYLLALHAASGLPQWHLSKDTVQHRYFIGHGGISALIHGITISSEFSEHLQKALSRIGSDIWHNESSHVMSSALEDYVLHWCDNAFSSPLVATHSGFRPQCAMRVLINIVQ